ncbi:hypothetical protein Clacol_003299 [Clathrus columnatus]|uniref:Uncharacterized protein n=1 Tax=Clathrus columnatus TaxID=1419009 RepID=A0AAV5A374_9AGAM|nr:hypothetical protein Clacol_003299 [Clathrus columnatus]
MSAPMKHGEVKYSELVCIGLGLSGICLGVQLKRKWNFKDMHFYDRNETHSGTCDVPIFLYSYSFAQRAWSKLLPNSNEIRSYISEVVTDYNLEPHMTFQTECEEAIWDKERSLWVLHMRNIVSGNKFVHECRILFSAVGQLSQPRLPDIPGIETFEGESFHSARWKEEVSLDGKDIVVIGNGCTASQIVPEIVPKAKSVTQIVKSAHWLFDFQNAQFPPGLKRAFENFPALGRIIRSTLFITFEYQWLLFPMNKLGAGLRKRFENQSKAYIREVAPEKYQDILVPDWAVGCKRRIYDPNRAYLKALHSDNLLLTKETILEIKPNGVLTDKRFYSADIIVYATGFRTNKDLGQVRIKGENGLYLDEYWNQLGGPSAYNSLCVAGWENEPVPNFFMLYGPNSNTGHTSVIITVENAIDGAFKLLAPLLKGEATKVVVKKLAYEKWAISVQEATRNCVFFSGGCNTVRSSPEFILSNTKISSHSSGMFPDQVGMGRPIHGRKFTFGGDKDSLVGKIGNINILLALSMMKLKSLPKDKKRSRFGSKFWTTATLLTIGGFAGRYYYYESDFDLVKYFTTTFKDLFHIVF